MICERCGQETRKEHTIYDCTHYYEQCAIPGLRAQLAIKDRIIAELQARLDGMAKFGPLAEWMERNTEHESAGER